MKTEEFLENFFPTGTGPDSIEGALLVDLPCGDFLTGIIDMEGEGNAKQTNVSQAKQNVRKNDLTRLPSLQGFLKERNIIQPHMNNPNIMNNSVSTNLTYLRNPTNFVGTGTLLRPNITTTYYPNTNPLGTSLIPGTQLLIPMIQPGSSLVPTSRTTHRIPPPQVKLLNPPSRNYFISSLSKETEPPRKMRKIDHLERKKSYASPLKKVPTSTTSAARNAIEQIKSRKGISPDGVLELLQGINAPPTKKLPGGKDNRGFLTPHVLKLRLDRFVKLSSNPKNNGPNSTSNPAQSFPTYSLPDITNFKVLCELFGYKEMDRKVEENFLTVLGERKLGEHSKWINPPSTLIPPNQMGIPRFVFNVEFRDIIIRYSSHNQGKKLFIRFTLISNREERLSSVDTFDFQTITRRGMEKQRDKIQKQREKGKKRAPAQGEKPRVVQVDPEAGINDQIVMLRTLNLPILSPRSIYGGKGGLLLGDLIVFFGKFRVEEIYAYNPPSCIVCRTPKGIVPGMYEVKVSLDRGKTYFGDKMFTVLDVTRKDNQQMELCIRHLRRKK